MQSGSSRRALDARRSSILGRAGAGLALLAVAVAASGCTTDGSPTASYAAVPSGTVAFESIDGPPVGVFHKLVQKLDEEAQARRLAVVSHKAPAQYRVRSYLAAHVVRGDTTIAWVWDVYDAAERRMLRITGEEASGRAGRDAWGTADERVLRRIAQGGMDRLAAFLAAPGESAPAPSDPTPSDAPQVAAAEVPVGATVLAAR